MLNLPMPELDQVQTYIELRKDGHITRFQIMSFIKLVKDNQIKEGSRDNQPYKVLHLMKLLVSLS